MQSGIFGCPEEWRNILPPGVRRIRTAEEVAAVPWNLLVLTPDSLSGIRGGSCRILLAPGDGEVRFLRRIHADHVITYGLSLRDSLTLSSLEKPTLCIQRNLPGADGSIIEPQEVPLPPMLLPAAEYLPLFGMYLLQKPLTDRILSDKINKNWREDI